MLWTRAQAQVTEESEAHSHVYLQTCLADQSLTELQGCARGTGQVNVSKKFLTGKFP